ncbi:MAG: diphthine--ammonia ligase [Caldisphaera sp.]|jgi:ABC transporter with metal-binding/Fe-S-binding domain ATP-binding protein
MTNKACAFFSGGKDSTYALHKAYDNGLEISCIISIRPMRKDSYMFHYPMVELTKLQTESMGFSDFHYIVDVSGEKEKEMNEILNELLKIKENDGIEFNTLILGGIASKYQYNRFKKIAEKLNSSIFDPQWGEDTEKYLYELVDYGIVFILSQITTYGLSEEYLGIASDKSFVSKIMNLSKRYGFHPAFEGGEAETFVVKAPLFKKDICIEGSKVKTNEFEYSLNVKKAELCNKFKIKIL